MEKYSRELNHQFTQELKHKVENYFSSSGLKTEANKVMILKSLSAVVYYFSIYALILSGWVENLYVMFFLWGLLGLGQAFIGMGLMHDVLHNSYTKSKWVKVLMEIPIHAIGIVSRIWKIEHNRVHHTHTNVESVDQDINPMFVFRFSPFHKRRWFHRFQHLYAPFFYGFRTFTWVTTKDFVTVFKYKKTGVIKSSKEFITTLLIVLANKLVFFVLFFVIPLLVLDYSWYLIFSMFGAMLFVSGLYMATVFQLAHVVPKTRFYEAEETQQQKTWSIHQMLTTSNFSVQNKWLTYLTGGLNHQIEHHLFPTISHVYYPNLSSIVKQTAVKYGVPYNEYDTLSEAVKGHFSFLRDLGASD